MDSPKLPRLLNSQQNPLFLKGTLDASEKKYVKNIKTNLKEMLYELTTSCFNSYQKRNLKKFVKAFVRSDDLSKVRDFLALYHGVISDCETYYRHKTSGFFPDENDLKWHEHYKSISECFYSIFDGCFNKHYKWDIECSLFVKILVPNKGSEWNVDPIIFILAIAVKLYKHAKNTEDNSGILRNIFRFLISKYPDIICV